MRLSRIPSRYALLYSNGMYDIFQAELKVNPTLWNKLDDDAKSLITSLLARNPKDRITARDALKHKFIQRSNV